MTNDATLVEASLFPHVVVRAGGRVVQELELRAELTVGRAEDNSLTLADPKVSRHHARIHREGTSFILTDLGSANGTRVDGVPVTGPHPLQHGERVIIGDAELTYLEPGRSLQDTIAAAGPPAAMRMAQQMQPARAAAPPSAMPAAESTPSSKGRSLGLAIGVGLIGVVLILAIVLVGIYLLNPGVLERIGLIGGATPTLPEIAASSTPPGEITTPVAPPPSAEAPTSTTGAIDPQEMNDRLTQAEALAVRSKFEEAIAIYEDLVQRAPTEPRPQIGWAWALILDDEGEQALPHAQKAVELDPSSSEAAAVLARASIATGDRAQGLAMAQQAVQLDSGSSEAHAVLAEAYMVDGQIQSAVDEADLALVQDINNADAHRSRGWLYHVAENDMGRAAGELQSAAGLQPELWLRRHELGMLLLEAEDYTTAILAFQDALGLRPKAVTYTAIGQAYYDLGQYDQARASAQQALSVGAQDADTYALLAATYAKQGRCDEAKTYYEQALALDATQPLALEAQDTCQGAGPSPSVSPTTAPTSGAAPASSPAATAGTSTNTPAPTKSPAPAPLSGRIAFPAWNPETNAYDSYIAKTDGSGRHVVVDGMHQPALSPDGNWLAVNGEKRDFMNLFIVKPDGSGLKMIADFNEDGQPAWSPDSQGLVLATTRDQPGHPQRIYVMDEVPFVGRPIQGRKLVSSSGDVQGEYPTWTPDNQIVYKGCDYTVLPESCGLFIIPVAGGDFKQLTNNGNDTAPAGYGGRIAFMSNRDGNWEIYSMSYDGSGLKRLTNNAANDGLPVWAPDGKNIAFVSDQGGAWAIWAMSPDGSNRRKLFEIGGGGLASDWQRERISWGP